MVTSGCLGFSREFGGTVCWVYTIISTIISVDSEIIRLRMAYSIPYDIERHHALMNNCKSIATMIHFPGFNGHCN